MAGPGKEIIYLFVCHGATSEKSRPQKPVQRSAILRLEAAVSASQPLDLNHSKTKHIKAKLGFEAS